MKNYYVNYNSQENGDNEVHVEGCDYMPEIKKYVGLHKSCKEAVANAKIFFPNSNGCKYCCSECHTN